MIGGGDELGEPWHPFGGGSTTCGSQAGLAFPVTVDSHNWPVVVAWSDYATRVYALRWDGSAWVRLGDPSGAGRFAVPAIISR